VHVLAVLNFCTRCSKVSTTNSESSAGLIATPFCWLNPPRGGGCVDPRSHVPAGDQVHGRELSDTGWPDELYL
jgi:hypothetical protein